MRFTKILFVLAMFCVPVSIAGANDFQAASQLLSAAKAGNIQQVQTLIASGANVNYIDSTGLSIVCTALKNNDTRASQILQMYGADASNCDIQIKNYNKLGANPVDTGIFSGLSTPQGMTLTVLGGAAVVGGIALLAGSLDLFGGNDNTVTNNSTECRPGFSCDCPNDTFGTCNVDGTCDCTDSGSTSTTAFTLPYGPAMLDAEEEAANYATNLEFWGPDSSSTLLADNFDLMTNRTSVDGDGQNYLLLMHGYSPLARGYLGQSTLRNNENAPINIDGNSLGTIEVDGGMPINVALITANGINSSGVQLGDASTNSSLDDRFIAWTTTNNNNTTANGASNDMISSKYYNNTISKGDDVDSLFDDTTTEDSATLDVFDLSNSGTAVGNGLASFDDDLLAKVVGGTSAGYVNADFIGFMPNGQMTIFRTGGGVGMTDVATQTNVGSFANNADGNFGTGATITISGVTYTVTLADDGHTFSAADSGDTNTINGYIGADGLLYLDTDTSTDYADVAYEMNGGDLLSSKETVAIDYKNYEALINAAELSRTSNNTGTGRSSPDILANVAMVGALRDMDAKTINDILSVADDNRAGVFTDLVNDYYDVNTTDGTSGTNDLPGVDAASFFGGLGSTYSPLVIFSTGAFDTGYSDWGGATLDATFENSAPIVFDNLEHLFMSVVSVGVVGGTDDADSISGYSPDKIVLSQWTDTNGTTDTSDDTYYKSRACGVAGTGGSDLDPWCFAAAGVTDEMGVASMAGAAGAVKSAFDYLDSDEIFILLALTASGPYLGTDTSGNALTEDTLTAYLQGMYELPNEYQYRVDGGEDYLDVFAEVFGYGLVDLERATKPGSTVYYYQNDTIVSASGDAYWRKATTTRFLPSSAFSISGKTIGAPFYDYLESVDGSMSMPRIWENEYAFGVTSARGLYMGDVLGGMNVGAEDDIKVNMGNNFNFSMNMAESSDVSNLTGLDWMEFGYSDEDFEFTAGFQNYFNDKTNRFDSVANPVLGLASDTITSAAKYKMGNFAFGARAWSGAITDESLLENDPTVSNNFAAAKLGLIQGFESSAEFAYDNFEFTANLGAAYESDTLLGAYSDGMLGMGSGETYYVDMLAGYQFASDIKLSLRSTFAKTIANNAGSEFIMGLSDMNSNSFSAALDYGNFSFAVASPLAITSGNLEHMHTEYEMVEVSDNVYDLVVKESGIRNMDLGANSREFRLSGYYNTELGTHTDAALGFIYRINPDNTNDFGNESVFMLKLKHSVGI